MRTTVDIADAVLERAKKYAAEHDLRLSQVVTDALVEKFSRVNEPTARPAAFVLPTYGNPADRPLIDITDGAALEDLTLDAARDPNTGQIDINKLR